MHNIYCTFSVLSYICIYFSTDTNKTLPVVCISHLATLLCAARAVTVLKPSAYHILPTASITVNERSLESYSKSINVNANVALVA